MSERFFKKVKLPTDTVVKADNGEERLNINNNLYRNTDDTDDVDFSRFAPAGEKPQVDQTSQVVLMIQPETDKKKEVLLRLIDKAISLL